MTVLIRSRFTVQSPSGLVFDGSEDEFGLSTVSRTQQNFKDDSDINLLIKRFRDTGLPIPQVAGAQYGDFSKVEDFLSAQNTVARVREYFDLLPSSVKARFDNDLVCFLSFVNEPKNYEEAVKLGIFRKPITGSKEHSTIDVESLKDSESAIDKVEVSKEKEVAS